jgi:hypothetical protein
MGPPKPVEILREPEFSRRLEIGEAMYPSALTWSCSLLTRVEISSVVDPDPDVDWGSSGSVSRSKEIDQN